MKRIEKSKDHYIDYLDVFDINVFNKFFNVSKLKLILRCPKKIMYSLVFIPLVYCTVSIG